MSITVTTQSELDAALKKKGYAEIIINSPQGVWLDVTGGEDKGVRASGSSTVTAFDSSTVTAFDSSTVRASGSSTVTAYDSSTVRASGSSTVTAFGSSTVTAFGSSTVRAYGSSTVRAFDSSTVRAFGSSTVTAYDSSTVRAFDSSTVRASGSSTVRASDSSTVTAYDSSTVRASDSSTVTAYDSSTVTASDSSTVTASGSSTVTASGSSTVTAYDSSTVRAFDSSTVRAFGSSTVRASNYVAVHLHSSRVTVDGGVVIDVTSVDRTNPKGWRKYHGVDSTGSGADRELIVYKAVDKDLKSGRGFPYPIGETVTDPNWKPGDFCGNGLHFSPSPVHASEYFREATRFLKVAVKVSEVSIIYGNSLGAPKLKARSARVLAEVTIGGDPV
jgi:hypothetical protein